MAKRGDIKKIAGAHKRAYERGETDGKPFLKPYVEAQKAVEASGQTFKAELTEAIRAI
jgi:hypothetical protein